MMTLENVDSSIHVEDEDSAIENEDSSIEK